jgi:hypothetical protein
MDSVSNQRLSFVCPSLSSKIGQMSEVLAPDNPPVYFRVTEGLRTWAEQAQLWAQGRTAPGTIVTDAAPGYSWHNFGCAVDLVPMIDLGPDWNITHPVWQRMMAVGDSLGLVHVDIKTRLGAHRDYPHFQMTGTWPTVPDEQVRTVFTDKGMQELWREGGLIP